MQRQAVLRVAKDLQQRTEDGDVGGDDDPDGEQRTQPLARKEDEERGDDRREDQPGAALPEDGERDEQHGSPEEQSSDDGGQRPHTGEVEGGQRRRGPEPDGGVHVADGVGEAVVLEVLRRGVGVQDLRERGRADQRDASSKQCEDESRARAVHGQSAKTRNDAA